MPPNFNGDKVKPRRQGIPVQRPLQIARHKAVQQNQRRSADEAAGFKIQPHWKSSVQYNKSCFSEHRLAANQRDFQLVGTIPVAQSAANGKARSKTDATRAASAGFVTP
ncbi:MAG: hypothetical protein QF384_00250 [Alphaproteobacteria bacterium]|nr:hypothetical protein [Alphaproteobacteria bacterium]